MRTELRKKGGRVGIATDHSGFGLKEELLARIRTAEHEVADFGAHNVKEKGIDEI